MNVNYDCVCRLCLSSRCELLPIFPTTSSDDSDPPVLASKIKDCVSVQISENDELPSNVCKKCMDNVNNWHIFKAVCERSQTRLQSLANKEGSQLEELNIKNEPLSDEAYDDGVVIDGSYPDSENAGPSHKLQPEGPPILASLGLTPRSDKKYVDPRMDWQRVHAILDMIQEDEVIDCLQSMEECDVIHQSDHDSDCEIDLSYDAVDNDYVDYKNGYLCKNGKVIAKKPKLSPEDTVARIKEASKLKKRSFVSNKHCSQPKSAWQMLFTDDLLELIVTSTNERIRTYGKKPKPANIAEIRTLIGILYYHGIMRPTHQKISDLWHEEYGVNCVRNAMSFERFKFILENISFDSEEDSIIQFDVMKRLRKVFEIFALNCRTSKEVSDMVVIDEVLLPIQGPCPFRYQIKKKNLKTGIKLMLLIDPVNFYVTNLDVITDPYFGSDEIAAKLVQHLAGTGRTIVMDSWFTSDTLINRLKNEYNLYTIGALHPNNENIPPLFLSHYRKKKTFISGFLDKDKTLSSYVGHSTKVVNVLTNDPKFYKKGNSSHTSVVSFYKKYHSAVEVVDVLMHYYTTMQHTNDWTLSLFFMLLNIGSVNAQVIWSSQDQSYVLQRRLFIRELALSLMGNKEMLTLNTSLSDIDFKRPKFSLPEHSAPFYKNRRRCKICFKSSLKRDRRTKQFCIKCGIFICKEHTVSLCTVCISS